MSVDPKALSQLNDIRRAIGRCMWLGECPTIAGGAVRNLVTGHTIRDIDVFFTDEKDLNNLVDVLHLEITRPPLGHNADCSSGEGVDPEEMKVWKCEADMVRASISRWTSFDLLWVPSIQGRIDKFPDHISKMWMRPNDGQILRRIEAQIDLNEQRLRYYSSQMRPKRLERLRELYGHWQFVDLDEVQLTVSTGKKRREPDHAPFWWDLPTISPERAMDAVRAMSEGAR